MSKVTALVSAYYAEKYLYQRIFNLFGYKGEIEIVVVCQQGSAEERIASDFDLTLVRTPDIPPLGEAWNLGIEHATGDYLTTANTDDRFVIDGLEQMVKTLDDNPDMGMVFAQVLLDTGTQMYPWKRINNRTGEIVSIKAMLEKACFIGPMPVWRKAIHNTVGYFDETYVVASDYDMWLRMARAGVRFWYIDEPTGIYLRRSDSLEHRNQALGRQESAEART